MNHQVLEKNTALMGILIALVISVAGLAEIVHLGNIGLAILRHTIERSAIVELAPNCEH